MLQRIFLYVLLTVLVMTSYCARASREERQSSQPIVSVTISHIRSGTMDITLSAPGVTSAQKQQHVISTVAGRILELNGFPGTPVKKGEKLAVVRTSESDAVITGARKLLQQASNAQQRKEAKRMLSLALKTQNAVTLHAEFNGIITARNGDTDEIIVANKELLTLIDTASFIFNAQVPVSQVQRIHVGQKATIHLEGDTAGSYPATVANTGAQADTISHAVQVPLHFVLLPQHISTLKLNQPGTADIIVDSHNNALLVPLSAVLRGEQTDSTRIVTITPDSLSKSVPVTVDATRDSTAEISGQGIIRGMPVITKGNYSLADSTRVTTAPAGREK